MLCTVKHAMAILAPSQTATRMISEPGGNEFKFL